MGKHKKKRRPERRPNPKPAGMPKRVDVERRRLDAIIEKASVGPLNEQELDLLRKALDTLIFLTQELDKKRVSVERLKQMLFGAATEKTRKVIERVLEESAAKAREKPADGAGEPEDEAAKGHGRNGADEYAVGEPVVVPHESLKEGDPCPECKKGKLYKWTPGSIVRVHGQPPLGVKVYQVAKLRCNLCGEIFAAKVPEGIGDEKYDAESASMIALLKYGTGMPFNRLEGLQGNLGIPLPASTQWEIVEKSAEAIRPAFDELRRRAAQGEVLHNDDTTMKILSLAGAAAEPPSGSPGTAPERKGVFTSGILSKEGDHRIALFFTGHRHAGENLFDLLKRRSSSLGAPIQMCDALSRNVPDELQTILANCLAHGRRKFVDVAGDFPEECLHVLEIVKDVYRNDSMARREGMTPENRLRFHQERSGPKMAELEAWMAEQVDEGRVEPNSGLGEAIAYMRKHWNALTLFLRAPGAPLDNNLCEQALKKAILHRKNAYFYKTEHGASVGDLFMSIIHTCELNAANALDYLSELQKHATELRAAPELWMPWNYRETLNRNPAATS